MDKGRYKTVLFDLDDTIFDHQYSRRYALNALTNHFQFTHIPIGELEKIHQEYLEITFAKVLEKRISVEDAREERLMLLFNHFHYHLEKADIQKAERIFRTEYNKNQRSIPGVNRLIGELKQYSKIGVITNGLRIQQEKKIEICGIGNYLDYLIISEEIGFKKPEKEFFLKSLEIIDNKNSECIVVGDSWELDILGAYNAGIRSIWLNRYARKCPDPEIAMEITSYENREEILHLFRVKM